MDTSHSTTAPFPSLNYWRATVTASLGLYLGAHGVHQLRSPWTYVGKLLKLVAKVSSRAGKKSGRGGKTPTALGWTDLGIVVLGVSGLANVAIASSLLVVSPITMRWTKIHRWGSYLLFLTTPLCIIGNATLFQLLLARNGRKVARTSSSSSAVLAAAVTAHAIALAVGWKVKKICALEEEQRARVLTTSTSSDVELFFTTPSPPAAAAGSSQPSSSLSGNPLPAADTSSHLHTTPPLAPTTTQVGSSEDNKKPYGGGDIFLAPLNGISLENLQAALLEATGDSENAKIRSFRQPKPSVAFVCFQDPAHNLALHRLGELQVDGRRVDVEEAKGWSSNPGGTGNKNNSTNRTRHNGSQARGDGGGRGGRGRGRGREPRPPSDAILKARAENSYWGSCNSVTE